MAILKSSILYFFTLIFFIGCATEPKDTTLRSLDDLPNDPIIEEDDGVIDHARQRAMEIYREFNEDNFDQTLRVEAKRRLADLELERSEELYFNDLQSPNDKTNKKSPASKNVELEQNFDTAIELYEDLLNNARGNSENDRILYQLAKAYENKGQQEKSLKLLDQLVSNFPNISYIDEIQFRRGELSFLLGLFGKAAKAYESVLSTGEFSLYYEKALYKHGWSVFKQEKYTLAMDSFFSLLDRKLINLPDVSAISITNAKDLDKQAEQFISKLGKGDQELVNDTFRVINIALGYLDGADSIERIFKKHGKRQYEYLVYKKLGDFFLNQERFKDSAEVYLAFANKYPADTRAPLFNIKVIDAYHQGGFAQLLLKAKVQYVKKYIASGKYWRGYDKKTRRSILPDLKKNMEELARHYHSLAQKSKKRQDYEEAVRWYRSYIKSFPKDEKVSMITYLLAEILFENKRYESAIEEYEKAAYRYRYFEKGAEAGYAALLSYAKLIKKLTGKDKENWRRLEIGSALRFGKVYPSDPRAANVLLKVAEDLFAKKKLNQATVAAQQILELTPQVSRDKRLTAWTIIAHTSFDKGRYKRAETSYKVAISLLKDKNKKSKKRKELVDGLALSIYKQGEQLKKEGNALAALEQFSRIGDVVPNSEINLSASFEVATNYLDIKDWKSAIKAFEKFRKQHPKHKLAASATQNLVVAYTQLNQPLKAARELENLIKIKNDANFKRQATWQIAEIYEKARQSSKAITTYKKYARAYPFPMEQSMEARQKLVDMYGSLKEWKKRNYWLKQIVEADRKGKSRRTDRTRYIAAHAAYKLARPVFKSYARIRLVEPLKKNLKRKKRKMKEAINAFNVAAEFGVADITTAATFHIAEIYNQLAKGLMESDRPKNLNKTELEQYDILLEEQAYPFEEKAIKIYETNTHRAKEGIYDEWVKKSFNALSKLFPIRYAKLEKGEAYADVFQ